MTRIKTALFLASVASGAILASTAQAQTNSIVAPANNNGETVLHGVGATSIQNVLVQEMNCIGATNFPLGLIGGTTVDTTDSSGNFVKGNGLTAISEPTDLPAGSGTLNCSTASLQPNFAAKYVASGSGFGKTAWQTAGTVNPFGAVNTTTSNPFETITNATFNPTPHTWTGVQYAFSDSNISQTDVDTYNTNVSGDAGPGVFFPKYVLPVAIAYNPVYGKKGSVELKYNVVNPKSILGVAAGGLPLNASTYCEIFNGYITNWNDAAITEDNANTPLFDTTNDTSTRWTTQGVPIRLVGRMDRSGTTDIFTRHLAAICSRPNVMVSGHVNKFQQHAETLPYFRDASSPNFSTQRSDTGLNPSSTVSTANTTNTLAYMSVSNTYYNGSAFVTIDGNASTAAPVVVGGKINGTGLFIVGNGSGRVSAAINAAPDYDAGSGLLLNGRIGYIGADFVVPSENATLFSAALKGTRGASSDPAAYFMPSAKEARDAFGDILPPQTDANGSFAASDTTRGSRSNPVDWTAALYIQPTTSSPTLARPTTGYPITGTTQFAGYTCYKVGNGTAIRNFLGWNMETVTTDYQGNSAAGVFTKDTAVTVSASGLLPRSNIGVMPDNWQKAIDQSFLSGTDGLNLQIREVSPTGTGTCVAKNGR